MLYNILIVMPMMVCLFWTANLLLDWRSSCSAKHSLAAFMAVCTLLYGCHYIFFMTEGHPSATVEGVYIFCNMAVFPMYYIYISRLTRRTGYAKLLLWVVPAIAVTVCFAVMPEQWNPAFQIVDNLLFLAELIAVSILGYRDLASFDRMVSNLYADTERRSVNKTRSLMLVLMGGALLSFIAKSIGRYYFAENPGYIALPSVFFSFLLFAVGYVGAKQNFCIDDIEDTEPADKGIAEPDADADAADFKEKGGSGGSRADMTSEHLLASLDKLMRQEKLYLRHDLKLADVVARMGVSRTVVSNLINQQLGMTFSDYISTLRVDHAKEAIEAMASDSNAQMLDVMLQSGFQSETSFYRAFKRRTGLTPKEWLRRNR